MCWGAAYGRWGEEAHFFWLSPSWGGRCLLQSQPAPPLQTSPHHALVCGSGLGTDRWRGTFLPPSLGLSVRGEDRDEREGSPSPCCRGLGRSWLWGLGWLPLQEGTAREALPLLPERSAMGQWRPWSWLTSGNEWKGAALASRARSLWGDPRSPRKHPRRTPSSRVSEEVQLAPGPPLWFTSLFWGAAPLAGGLAANTGKCFSGGACRRLSCDPSSAALRASPSGVQGSQFLGVGGWGPCRSDSGKPSTGSAATRPHLKSEACACRRQTLSHQPGSPALASSASGQGEKTREGQAAMQGCPQPKAVSWSQGLSSVCVQREKDGPRNEGSSCIKGRSVGTSEVASIQQHEAFSTPGAQLFVDSVEPFQEH